MNGKIVLVWVLYYVLFGYFLFWCFILIVGIMELYVVVGLVVCVNFCFVVIGSFLIWE